jgi:hypothetical protein
MSSSFPRSLSSRERALLDPLLAQEFPGVEELRVQARSVRVKGLHNDLPTIVLLEVVDSEAPRAAVAHPVPVETRVRRSDPPQEVLLFVRPAFSTASSWSTTATKRPQSYLPPMR